MPNENLLPAVIGTTIETVFTYVNSEIVAPGAGLVGSAVANYLLKRNASARDILRSELERTGATAEDFHDTEQFAAAALRYTRAVRDQAADENLRLLAQAMAGLARRETLWASDFIRYADILSVLSRDEILLVGCLMREDANAQAPEDPAEQIEVWNTVVAKLVGNGVFPSEAYLEAVTARSQRTGLIIPTGTFDGGYRLSPIGRSLRHVVNIEQALRS
ncbi:MAG TPA: hypothetical protein VF194_07240 [Ferrovibrio sp.]|uniref:hypothetical protein n=1 Tax=Ferrovibrio sp. TaxID=1917215 RepID=UPI002ED16DB5